MHKIAIISDVHGNIDALKRVLDSISSRKIEQIYCLGDLVGYYCHFNEVVNLVAEMEIPTVLGNHDYALAHNNGVISRSKTCTSILSWQLDRIDEKTSVYLKSLPDRRVIDWGGKSILLVHGGLKDSIDEYVFDADNSYIAAMPESYDVLLTGHTHIPAFKGFLTGKSWLNPGSVGQPRDGDHRASYLIIDEDWNLEFIRVPYDFRKLMENMTEKGFASYISDGLPFGRKL